jgi:pyrroline-5-carboxylate reductase
MVRSLLASELVSAEQLVVTAAHDSTLARFADLPSLSVTLDNRAAVEGADVVLLCVKPQKVVEVLDEIRTALKPGQLLLSIAAGATISMLEEHVEAGTAVARAMPNTPSSIGAGMTAICMGTDAGPEELRLAQDIFGAMGRTTELDESSFDAVTGLSASGPAFIYVVIEALAEGGVKVGLPRAVATELAAQACYGAAKMVLETGNHPALLKDDVTTPAGCTVDGLLELEDGGLRVTLIKAVVEAKRRAEELVS